MPNRIQMSQETTDLLIAAGKSQWLRARQEKVNAKGKGELQTYWLDVHHDSAVRSTSSGGNSAESEKHHDKDQQASSTPVHSVMAAPISFITDHPAEIRSNGSVPARAHIMQACPRETGIWHNFQWPASCCAPFKEGRSYP